MATTSPAPPPDDLPYDDRQRFLLVRIEREGGRREERKQHTLAGAPPHSLKT